VIGNRPRVAPKPHLKALGHFVPPTSYCSSEKAISSFTVQDFGGTARSEPLALITPCRFIPLQSDPAAVVVCADGLDSLYVAADPLC